MDNPSDKGNKSHNVSYNLSEDDIYSKDTLNNYKKLPFAIKEQKNKGSHNRRNDSNKRPEMSDKRHNLYLGTKLQPAWETRTLNINPVSSDDLSRFLRNEQHTQRWSIISQIFYILLYNLRRLPFLWSILIFLCEILVPLILPNGIPKRSWYSSAIPLFVSLFMSFFVNVLEFKKRYNLGRYLDNKRCVLIKDGKLSSIRSGNVIVGNILKLSCDDQVPADAVVLYSSNPDGTLYIDTCYLDGQTDLKTKYSVRDTKMESSIRSYNNLKGNIVCDKPSPDMNKFSGLLKIKGYPRPNFINIDNFIMRGSILRNTNYIYAVVVYTGPDTKASQNFLRILKPIKIGCLEHTINKISIILGLIYLLCTITSITIRYVNVNKGIGNFTKNSASLIDSLVFIIFRFVVLYSPLLPTTLPAIMDLLRLLYLPFYDSHVNNSSSDKFNIEDDKEVEHFEGGPFEEENKEKKDKNKYKKELKKLTKKKKVNNKNHNNGGTWTLNSGLCEELGLVDFIFTDKTGTLTTNNLSITLVTIMNKSYTPKQLVQIYSNDLNDEGGSTFREREKLTKGKLDGDGLKFDEDEDNNSNTNNNTSDNEKENTNEDDDIREHFMRMLCICNPCLNTESVDSFNTYSSSYNLSYSKASSFKLSHFQTKSFNISSSNTSSIKLNEEKSLELDEYDENVNKQDNEIISKSDNPSSSGNVEQLGSESYSYRLDDDEEEERDSVDNLPMFKKTKSKAHFGTVSYINLDHPTISNNILYGVDNYDSMNKMEDKRYLNCISKEDECMVNLANESGYLVVNRSKDKIVVNCNGKYVNYDIIGINEFTSSRKRMSVLLTNLMDNENYLYVKGEAQSILSCIKDNKIKSVIQSRLRKNSIFGYRVIICCYKILTSTELLEYESNLRLTNITSNCNLSEDYLNELEDNLKYLGIIMFRDEIQKDITGTIDLFMDAGIRIWVLTGDNKESTIQTCYLTKLLNVPTHLFIIQLTGLDSVDFNLSESTNDGFENGFLDKDGILDYGQENNDNIKDKDVLFDNIYNKFLIERSNRNNEQLCLVIESKDLDVIMSSSKGQNVLVNMACSADVVLGCLLTPVQKGQLVQLIRTKLVPTPITLSIGDGINDIQMLQHSHISICLQPTNRISNSNKNEVKMEGGVDEDKILEDGNESEELKSESIDDDDMFKEEKKILSNDVIGYCDFCIDNFSNLRNLLFVQGTRILRAMSLIIYFTIYKSILMILPLFYYQIFTNWVGLDLYGSFINILYCLVFTLIPLVVVILFHQDIDSELYLRLPVLYTLSRRRIYLNLTNSLFWILEGFVGSLVNYVPLHLLVITNHNVFKTEIISNRTFGLLISVASIVIFNTRLLIIYTPNNLFFNLMSIIYYFVSVPIYLGLTFLMTRRSLKISSYQLIRVAPFYLLIPMWITFTVIMGILSNLLQLYLLPNLTKYLKSYLNSVTEKIDNISNSFTDLRNVFNLYGSNIVKRMIPTSRPFKVKNSPNLINNKSYKQEENNINRLINMYTLRFKDIQLENDYRLDKNKKHYYENGHWYKIVFILLFGFYLFGFLIEYFVQKSWFRAPIIYSIIPTILLELVLIVCIIVSFNHNLFIRFINHILYSLVTFMILQHLANRFLLKSISWLHPVLFPIFTFVILRISFVLSLITNIIFFIGTLTAIRDNIHVIPLFIGINIFVGFVGYGLEYKSRSNFIMEFSVVNYRKKQSELLNTMLPKEVVSKMINAKLNENGIPIGFEAESHENVSVIFADVYNFQNLISTIEPHKLVEILDNLFLSFDKCSKEFGAMKIETVSESYLTSMGLKHNQNNNNNQNVSKMGSSSSSTTSKINRGSNDRISGNINEDEYDYGKISASSAIDMSIAMLQISQNIKINNNETIGIKIGINSGRVISGLVGSKKPQYALFGDTVNTASRMKMTGVVGRIHISNSTYELVKDDSTLEFTPRDTEVKGKGIMKTYLLKRALGSSYPDFSNVNSIHEVDIYYDHLKRKSLHTNISLSSLNKDRESLLKSETNVSGLTMEGGIDEDKILEGGNESVTLESSLKTSSKSSRSSISSKFKTNKNSNNLLSVDILKNVNNMEDGNESDEQQFNEENQYSHFEGGADEDVNSSSGMSFRIGDSLNLEDDGIDMDRIRNRRLNINRAVGNEVDDYVGGTGLYDMYTSNYSYSLLLENSSKFGNKCCNKCIVVKRSNRLSKRKTKRLSSNRFSTSKLMSIRTNRLSSSSTTSKINRLSRRMRTSISSINLKNRKSRKSNVVQNNVIEEKNKDLDEIHMKKTESVLLKFKDKLQEDRYRNNFYNSTNNVAINEYALFIFFITFIVQSIININLPRIYNRDNNKYIVYLNYLMYWTVRCFFILISFTLWILFHYNFFSYDINNNKKGTVNLYNKDKKAMINRNVMNDTKGDKRIKLFTFFLNLLFVSATCVFALSNSWSIKRTDEVDGNVWLTSDSIEFYFYIVLLHHSTGLLFQNCLLIDSLFLVMSITFIASSVRTTSTTVTALFTIPICVLFNLLSAHCKESIDRKTFFTNEKAYMIETRINQILNEMLPKSILEEFKQEKLKMSYVHHNMTFLFSDICGFTSWANSVDPSEVIALLQKLFANFDRNTTNFNLYKLCTIGDAYVAISEPYLTDTNDMRLNDLLNILQMAYSMLHIIQETRELFNIPNLNMRIGLHYGTCIGGVIGSGRLRYDVWGTDIYTANMMESNGIPGKICVSESLKEILSNNFPNRFTFKFNKDINVVDKVVKSYILEYDSQESF